MDNLNPLTYNDLQLIKIKWENQIPFFLLYDDNKKDFIELSPYNKIKITKSSSKLCLGRMGKSKKGSLLCNNRNPILPSQKFCLECDSLNLFKYCVRCTGDSCYINDKNILEYCKQPYIVYLAYFPDNIIKVGVSNSNRKYNRLTEQGCLYALIIAHTPNGKLARIIENYAHKMGYKSLVNSKYKIQHLINNNDEKTILDKLTYCYENIKNNINPNYKEYILSSPEFVKNSVIIDKLDLALKSCSFEQLNFWESIKTADYDIIQDANFISGDILALIGNIALIKSPSSNKIKAFDFKSFYGWKVNILIESD